MYRVFCESYKNYVMQHNSDDYRSKLAEPLGLIADVHRFNTEKEKERDIYKRLCDLLFFLEQNMEKYPRARAFLWTIESRGMVGKYYRIAKLEDLNEQAKVINMILKLVYWNVA